MGWPPNFGRLLAEEEATVVLINELRNRIHSTRGSALSNRPSPLFSESEKYEHASVDSRIDQLIENVREGYFLKLVGQFEAESSIG